MTYYNDNLTSIRSSFGTASSSSSQVVPAEDTDVGNDQIIASSEMELTSDALPHVISNADESHNEDCSVAVPPVPVVIVPLALIPSLRGKLVTDGALNVCRGVWAMSDAAHDIPEQTSDFEFKLVKSAAESVSFPFTGRYQGWFALKQPPPIRGSIKIEDRDMYIKFSAIGDGTYKVEGNGTNKFGKFTLRGLLGTDHVMQIYREYQYKPLPSPRKRSAGTALGLNGDVENSINSSKSLKKKIAYATPMPGNIEGIKTETVASISGFREGTGRARKPSSTIKDPDDHITAPKLPMKAAIPLAPKSNLAAKAVQAPVTLIKTESGRAQRPPPQMQKCSELLKEMMKMPQAIWFSEPVDPVKMNVPDYPTLIKQPMDFGTVRTNLDNGVYDSPEALADHVRLTFRNAITYNQLRDNPVHVAARELAKRFEEKFRMMLTQFSSGAYTSSEEVFENKVGRPAGSGGRKSSIGGGAKTKNYATSSGVRQRPSGGAGPRPVETFFPLVVDGSTQTILAMQRQMEDMASELKMLRTKVMQSEVKHDLDIQRDAAQNPLTFQEKKSLISKIHQLPASKMQQVVDIIQDAIPPEKRGEGDEIEIPLDELDTFTLRKLQSFVEEHNSKKKPNAPTKEGALSVKRPRKDKAPVSSGRPAISAPKRLPGSTSSSALASQYGSEERISSTDPETDSRGRRDADMMDPLGDSIEEDDLFFSNESFDDLRAQAAENGTSDASDNEDPDTGSLSLHSSTHSGHQHRPHEAGQVATDFQARSSVTAISPHNPTRHVGQWQQLGVDGDEIKVANVSAWTKRAPDSEDPSSHGGESSGSGNKGTPDVWSSATLELEAKQSRERERKLDEERSVIQRAAREAERIALLSQMALMKQQEKEQQLLEEARQREQEASELQQRRLDERKAREDMVMTVDLDTQHEAINFDGDM